MTVRAQRRAMTRKAERARWRRSLRSTLAALRREYGPDFQLFRLERACPCGHCGRPLPDDYRPTRGGWATPEVRAVHDAHTARLLALWEVTVWRPELAAAGWLRLVLALVRLRDAVRVLAAVGLRVRRAAVFRARPLAVYLATSLDLSPPLTVATLAGGAAMPP